MINSAAEDGFDVVTVVPGVLSNSGRLGMLALLRQPGHVVAMDGEVPADLVAPAPAYPGAGIAPVQLDVKLLELERAWLLWALKLAGGNKSKAAELLGIKRSTLGDRIKRALLDDRESEG
jgi:DNA-binding NtrC family response regulator